MNLDTRRCWAEIHLNHLDHNYRQLRALAPESRFAGLVKANAYGHGAVPVARRLEALGADCLLVACLSEALELREAGVTAPILLLGYTDPADTALLLAHDLIQTIYDPALARAMSDAALAAGGRLRCHLKADTGMSRLGLLCREEEVEAVADAFAAMYHLPGLAPEGIFQHFADADTSPEYSQMQYRRFRLLLAALERRGCRFRLRHCCAGAATLTVPEAHLDMIRPGIPLYGYAPDPSCEGRLELRPVMEVKARVASVKHLPKGTCVSYGRTYTLTRDSVVVAVSMGYADGLPRLLSGRFAFRWRGQPLPQIGRICMDMCMADATDLSGIQVGDEVTLFGGDGAELTELADTLGTIPYELLCGISPRVTRIYIE